MSLFLILFLLWWDEGRGACTDPENVVRGGQTLTMFVLFFNSPEPKLIVWDWSRRPSVRVFTLSNMNISETSCPIKIKFSSEASLGWGIDCIRFWARLDQNSGFHGNIKLP